MMQWSLSRSSAAGRPAWRDAVAPHTRRLRAWWTSLSARERVLVGLAAVLLLGALLWWVLMQPALRTLQTAPIQRAAQEQQLGRMRQLQTQARQLQALPRVSTADSQQLLMELSPRLLGPGSNLVPQGGQLQVTLRNVPPAALAEWLQQARTLARAVPVQAQIDHTPGGWSGTVVLRLPS